MFKISDTTITLVMIINSTTKLVPASIVEMDELDRAIDERYVFVDMEETVRLTALGEMFVEGFKSGLLNKDNLKVTRYVDYKKEMN